MSGTVCPLYNEYDEELRWSFTEPLGTCVYNAFDQIAFIVGWMSVAAWTFALLPQIVTNCKNKAAESQSFWFWMLWLIGDVANFSGCILTHNLITNIALAFVYLTITAFACLQFVWYEYLAPTYFPHLYPKHHGGGGGQQHTQQLIIHKSSISPSSSHHHQHFQYQKPKPLRTQGIDIPEDRSSNEMRPKEDAVMWRTPKFARPFPIPNGKAMSMSPRLGRTLKLLHRSPRVFAVTPQLSDTMKMEYDAIRAQQRENSFSREHSVSYSNESGTHSPRRHTIKYYSHHSQDEITPRITPLNSVKKVAPQSTAYRPDSTLALNDIEQPKLQKENNENTAVLQSGVQSNYGSIGTIMSTMSSMTVTVVMLYGLQSTSHSVNDNNNNGFNGSMREMMATNSLSISAPDDSNGTASTLLMIGMILGWISSVIYISSRIPQMRLMVKTKDVAGINPMFFGLTFTGNLTQCLSMLINKQIYVNQSDLMSKLPWLASSSVCIFQDFSILVLIWLYRSIDVDAVPVIRKGSGMLINESRSKGIMIPSPGTPIYEGDRAMAKKSKGKKRNGYLQYEYGDEKIEKRESKYAVSKGSINSVGKATTLALTNTI